MDTAAGSRIAKDGGAYDAYGSYLGWRRIMIRRQIDRSPGRVVGDGVSWPTTEDGQARQGPKKHAGVDVFFAKRLQQSLAGHARAGVKDHRRHP